MTYEITTEYMKRNRAMAVPGAYWDMTKRRYVVDDPTPRAALVLLKLFPELGVYHPELHAIRDAFVQDVRPLNFAQEWWDSTGGDEAVRPPLAPTVEARMAAEGMAFYRFQRIDLSYLAGVLKQHGSAYLGWERGLGKTLGAIALAENTGAKRILVVSSNTAKTAVWQPEWIRWGADMGIPYAVIPNDKKKRDAHLDWMQANKTEPLIQFVHYESLNLIAKTRANRRGWQRFGEWDLVAIDEGHHLANKWSLQTRSAKMIPTRMKLNISGSIISNHASELYSQLNWLYPKRYSDEQRDWADRFLDWVDLEGHREYIGVRLDRLEALRDELGRFLTYRRKEDELDLPPITIQDYPITLGNRQRKAYDDFARNAIVELESGEVLSASSGMVLLGKLRQVATGLDLVSNELVDSAKLDAAVELIQSEPDQAFVVFSYFIGAAEALAGRLAHLGIPAFTVHMGVNNEDRTDFIKRFQAGEGRVFIGTLGTLGESVTLSRASNVVFLDRSWNPQLNDQAVDRVAGGFRALQVGRPITITNLVAKDTVDETRVTPTLSSKAAVRAVILGRRKPARM